MGLLNFCVYCTSARTLAMEDSRMSTSYFYLQAGSDVIIMNEYRIPPARTSCRVIPWPETWISLTVYTSMIQCTYVRTSYRQWRFGMGVPHVHVRNPTPAWSPIASRGLRSIMSVDSRGIKRGHCMACGCVGYSGGDNGMKCITCGHPPVKHHNLSSLPSGSQAPSTLGKIKSCVAYQDLV